MKKQNDKEDPIEDAVQKCKEEMQLFINKINRNLLGTIKSLEERVTGQDEEIARLKKELQEVQSQSALEEEEFQPSSMEEINTIKEQVRRKPRGSRHNTRALSLSLSLSLSGYASMFCGSPESWGASCYPPPPPPPPPPGSLLKGINLPTAFSPDRRAQFNKYVQSRVKEAGHTPISVKRLSKTARTRAAPADIDEMHAYVKEELTNIEARILENMNAFKYEMRGEIHTLEISMYANWREEMQTYEGKLQNEMTTQLKAELGPFEER
ncbi:hypothetical protein L7F22_054570 [Adiantum nelumboides]|nr:hypothetical protein [Adiantum nelumboides]